MPKINPEPVEIFRCETHGHGYTATRGCPLCTGTLKPLLRFRKSLPENLKLLLCPDCENRISPGQVFCKGCFAVRKMEAVLYTESGLEGKGS